MRREQSTGPGAGTFTGSPAPGTRQLGLARLAAAAVLAAGAQVQADQSWVGTTGDWAQGTNWSGGIAMPANESAAVDNGGTAQIGSAASLVYTLHNHNNSAVEVNAGGSLRVRDNLENAGATMTVNSGGTLTLCGQALQGGTTIVNSGGTLNFGASDDSSWGRIGNNIGTLTTFQVNGGTVNAQYTEGDGLVVGDFYTSTVFTMTPGSQLNMFGKRVNVGWWNGGNGQFTNSGGAINFDNAGGLWVGAGGDGVTATGLMVLDNGATVTKAAGSTDGELLVGTSNAANVGTLEVHSGASIAWMGGRVTIGNNGARGTLLMDGATSSIDTGNNEFQVGNDPGGVGTATINGGTLTTHSWTAISRNGGNGHLILNDGTMTVTGEGGYLQVVAGAGGTGVIDINGGVLTAGTVRYQDWGESTTESWGTINLNGGRFIAGDISRKNYGETVNHAVFNFNGGVLQPTGGNVLHDLEAAYVQGGGAIIEFTQNNTTINQPLLDGGGGGGLTVRGNGVFDTGANDQNMLILPNYGSTFTGEVVVTGAAHVRLGDGAGNTGDGMLGAATNIVLDNGGLKNNNSSAPILGPSRTITLGPGGGFFTVGWGDLDMEAQGKVTGPGALSVGRDGGNLVLSNPANDYAGNTRIGADVPGRWTDGWSAGLYLGASEVIPDGPGKGNLIIDGGYGGHLNLRGFSETVNGLSDVNGGTIYNSGAAATLAVGNNDATSTYGGTIQDSITLRKVGAGTLTLTADNSYTGATAVTSGTLALAGSADISESPVIDVAEGATLDVSAMGSWTLASGQTLQGNGTVAGTTAANGTLAPGNSPGTLSVTGTVLLGATSTLDWDLDGGDTTPGSGINDLLAITGNLTLDGTIHVTATDADPFSTWDEHWTIITYTGELTDNGLALGTMPALPPGWGWTVDTTSQPGEVWLVIPEPAATALAALGLLGLLRRRRR